MAEEIMELINNRVFKIKVEINNQTKPLDQKDQYYIIFYHYL